MEIQKEKQKLTIEEQIQDMIDKNIQFDLCSQEDAKRFLTYNNYYFKLKSYARNYNIDFRTKKYFNLDFAYLVELSKLDMYIRQIILELSLDVEHYLKVRLMNVRNQNSWLYGILLNSFPLEILWNCMKCIIRHIHPSTIPII